jgi:hypothetical protein
LQYAKDNNILIVAENSKTATKKGTRSIAAADDRTFLNYERSIYQLPIPSATLGPLPITNYQFPPQRLAYYQLPTLNGLKSEF